MASFVIKSKQKNHVVCVNDKDLGRIRDYATVYDETENLRIERARGRAKERGCTVRVELAKDYDRPLYSWHIVWKADKIDAVAVAIYTGFRSGTKYGRKTRQVKLHDFIMGDIPKCKAVRHRDGNPLNNRRENLVLYQVYHRDDIKNAPLKRKIAAVCRGCKEKNTCQKVATRKKLPMEKDGIKYEN